jgi:hypothetical protein
MIEKLRSLKNSTFGLPALLFAFLWLQGSLLGLSDDEAYHWVLAQRPALGYAYHPPGMAWFVAASRFLLGSFTHSIPQMMIRFPSSLTVAIILWIAILWAQDNGVRSSALYRVFLIMLSFAGLSSLGWMMVPDTPLFLGWAILFYSSWKFCRGDLSRRYQIGLVLGSFLVLIGKFSGVLALGSAFLAIFLWAKEKRFRGLGFIFLGALAALVPILIWNSQHEWASILYQIQGRHEGASINALRYARFWLAELVIAGPVIIAVSFTGSIHGVKNLLKGKNPETFAALWILPALLVFCVQPLFSDFKPHWAFAVWLPAAFLLALRWGRDERVIGVRVQVGFGVAVFIFVILCLNFPLGSALISHFSKGAYDPRLDVTNDLYGWRDFPDYLRSLGADAEGLPRTGSRYQTAAQTATALQDSQTTSLMPKEIRSFDEWPALHIGNTEGPEWPLLTHPVLYISDNRYDAPPAFKNAKCRKLGRMEKYRGPYLAKWIQVDRCDPIH